MSSGAVAGLQDVTIYSPVRVFLAGLWRLLFGVLIGFSTFALFFAMVKTSGEPASAADPPRWLIPLAGAFLGLLSLAVMSGGLGRMISAFAGNCYFRAGRDGISVRFPRQKWFGRFRVTSYWLKWSEVDRIVHFTFKTNGIPTGTELRIHLNDGTRLTVDRMYFSASIWSIQQQLLSIRKMAGV